MQNKIVLKQPMPLESAKLDCEFHKKRNIISCLPFLLLDENTEKHFSLLFLVPNSSETQKWKNDLQKQ